MARGRRKVNTDTLDTKIEQQKAAINNQTGGMCIEDES